MSVDNCGFSTKIQNGFTYIEVIPGVGVIGSALRVIFSLGEMVAGYALNNKELIKQAKFGLQIGCVNILLAGLPMLIFAAISFCDDDDPFLLYNDLKNS
ncbi:MAG TPA: hypothetical protein DCE71_01730 [Parachlamydiales bacterium]|nr:hypothetical protein [Parachlamydiales bacterium]